MKISRPNFQEPTPEDLATLEKLKAVIEQAIADGKLTQDEVALIRRTAWSNGKITPEELNLVREMVTQKVNDGLIQWVW